MFGVTSRTSGYEARNEVGPEGLGVGADVFIGGWPEKRRWATVMGTALGSNERGTCIVGRPTWKGAHRAWSETAT
jgi:hypothetical protein